MAYRASEEDYGHGYGGGLGGEGGAITSQINRGTDQIREDLARGGEAVRDANRNYFQNIGDALEKGVSGYEHGQDIAYKKQAQAREAQRFNTEEEAAKQMHEKGIMELAAGARRAKSEEAQQAFNEEVDPETGLAHQTMAFKQPFEQFNLNKKVAESGLKTDEQNRLIATSQEGRAKAGEERTIAAGKRAMAEASIAARVGSQIMNTPHDQLDQVSQKIMAQTPPELQAATWKSIGDARAQKFSQTLAENSTPEGQLKVQLHKQAYTALTDANELRGKLNTFMNNKEAGGINVGLTEIPTNKIGLGLRNDVADNALQEIAGIISKDGTPQAQKLAEKLTSPYRMDQNVINEVNAYINGKERETKNLVERNKNFFPAGEKDEYQNSLMHLLKGIGGDKNRPTAKSLTNEQVSGFLTGFSPDAPEQQYKMQPAAAVAPPPQPQQPAQSGMGSPMPAVPKPKSALELRYGGKK